MRSCSSSMWSGKTSPRRYRRWQAGHIRLVARLLLYHKIWVQERLSITHHSHMNIRYNAPMPSPRATPCKTSAIPHLAQTQHIADPQVQAVARSMTTSRTRAYLGRAVHYLDRECTVFGARVHQQHQCNSHHRYHRRR